jgi:hypothetical protein
MPNNDIALTAQTPIASTVHHPFGSPAGPGLWHVKGMELPAYIQNVAHALIRSGAAHDESRAIEMAVGVVQNWAAGHDGQGNRVSADVQAAATKAIAEWEAKRAIAHAQRSKHSDHSMVFDAWGQAIELSPSAAERRAALQEGHALPPHPGNSPGKARFPITDVASLRKAISMVGLARPGTQAIVRRYIWKRAVDLNAIELIPKTWNMDGSTGGANG